MKKSKWVVKADEILELAKITLNNKNEILPIQPGDLFVFILKETDEFIDYSSAMKLVWANKTKRYCPADGLNLLMSLDDTTISWYHDRELYTTTVQPLPSDNLYVLGRFFWVKKI